MPEALKLPPPVRYLDPHDETPDVERWWWWETDSIQLDPKDSFYDWYFLPIQDGPPDVRLHVIDYPKKGYLDDGPEFVLEVRAHLVAMIENVYWDWQQGDAVPEDDE